MGEAIGSVRATFTASAAGLLGAINQSVGGFGNFASAAKRTAAQQGEFTAKMATLSSGLASGGTSVEQFGEQYTRLNSRFRNAVSETDRIKVGLDALRGSQAAAGMSAEQLAEAESQIVATAKAATPALERLKTGLAENKAAFDAGSISVEEYRNTIATLPGAINGSETDQQTFNRVLQESRGILSGMDGPTAKYERQLETLNAALERGIIDDQQHAAATQNVRAAMAAADPAAQALAATMKRGEAVTQANLTATEKYDAELAELKGLLAQGAISQETFARASKKAEDTLNGTVPKAQTLGQAFGGMPGPIGAAARALDQFGGGLTKMMAGFSGGFGAGLKTMFSDIGSGLSNAFKSGGSSLLGIAPQIAVIGAAVGGAVVAITRLTGALRAVGSEVERTGQLADRLGVSFQEYEVLAVAAANAGVEVESLAGAQTKFLKAVSGARGGADEQVKAFQALGISQEELNSTDPSELLERAAEKLNAIEDPATRATLTMKLFGKTGNDVLPALAAIDATREGIARLGGTMSAVDVTRFSQLDDAFDNVGVAGSRLGKVLLTPFTELFTRVATGLAAVTGGLAKAFAPIGNLFAEIGGAFGLIVERIGAGVGYALRFVGALLQLSGITTTAAAIGAQVDQLSRYFAAVDSFIEPIIVGLEQVAAFVSDNILRGVTAVYTIFGNLVAQAAEYVAQSSLLSGLFSTLAAGAELVKGAFTAIGGWVTYVVEQLEYWAGIEPKPMINPQDKESIEAQMKAQEELAKKQEEEQKKAEQRAATIREDVLSPYEKMQKKMEELNDLEQRGLLTAEERAKAEAKIRDEFAKQDPIALSAAKHAEEQKKALDGIDEQIRKSATAGFELGAAGEAARDAFKATAEEIKDGLAKGLIDPDVARTQMEAAVAAMNAELQNLGEDQKFAEKIREELESGGSKLKKEMDKIDANKTLTGDEKEKAKQQLRDKESAGLAGGDESPVKKFRDDQKKLREALKNNVIGADEFAARSARVKESLDDSLSEARDKQENAKGASRKLASAVNVNSSEGASEFFRLLQGQDDPTKKQLKEMEKQTRLLEQAADALKDNEVVAI
jgi:hypothetical protein